MSLDHEPHEPQPDCDCHACAIWERDKLREIVGALRWPIHADDRKAAQATGKHPAPCARFCEANAFEIGERMLRAQIREERRLLTEFTTTVERCYRMLLSEPDTKGALFKAENILREALADQKVGAGATAPEGHNAKSEGAEPLLAKLPLD